LLCFLATGIALVLLGSALFGASGTIPPATISAHDLPGGVPTLPASADLAMSPEPSFPTPIQHVVVVLMENQNYATVLAEGPYEAYLAQAYGQATNDYSVHHYSIPAYLAATSGIDSVGFSVHDDRNIGDLSDESNESWAAFEQGMPTVCDSTTNWKDGYDASHNPFIMYKDIEGNTTRCDAHDLTWSSWTNDVNLSSLPNYSFITPNTTNDDHNSSIPVGDAWLKSWLSPLINDSAIFSNTAFIVSYDESGTDSSPTVNGSSGGQVYTVVVSPYSRDLTSNVFYNTYSLLTSAEWILGLPSGSLGADNWTLHPPMTDLFSFGSPHPSVTFTETGLLAGTNWSVTLGNAEHYSTTENITFAEPDGTYLYAVQSPLGYNGSPVSGSLTVNDGGEQNVSVTFTQVYPVTFTEKGLPSGTPWNVTIGPVTMTSNTSTIVFEEPSGSYPFQLGVVPGWKTTETGAVEITSAHVGVLGRSLR
jgi:hypothetical protein